MKPLDPVKLLEDFRKESGQSIRGMAKVFGLDSTFLNRILLRKRRPGADAISAIDRGTNGKVPSRLWGDWFRSLEEEPVKTRKTG
jgi:transcriptional regulator with XRE-family HTH domain